MSELDVVIVSGGTAGCVRARRLMDSGDQTVLLLEAGARLSEQGTPEETRDASVPPMSHDWGCDGADPEGTPPVVLPRGRTIGGSSASNYAFAMPPAPPAPPWSTRWDVPSGPSTPRPS